MNLISYINSSHTDPIIVKNVCQGLRQMRLNRNISQESLAESAGLSRITISRMESGRAATLLTLVQVLRALDKLEVLNSFIEQPLISPIEMLKQQKKQRKKASHRSQNNNSSKHR
jgi:transcriptional regulator with XRE-family HTH domain